MKILCFIDSLGSGGAQRQLVALALGLLRRGHEVRFLVYHSDSFFLPKLEAARVSVYVIKPCSHYTRALRVRRFLRQGWQDLVLAFLEGPCFYAEMARIPKQNWSLIAGERLAHRGIVGLSGRLKRQGHRFADVVVANSHSARLLIEGGCSFLRGKVGTIYNTVDLDAFRPTEAKSSTSARSLERRIRIVIAASYQEKKNMMGLAQALLRLKSSPAAKGFVVHWFGDVPRDAKAFRDVQAFVRANQLEELLHFKKATDDINVEIQKSDAVALFSFYEGLPNIVCEGMACGKPIIMSDVCDAGNLVGNGQNGFLCDPSSPSSIAGSLEKFCSLDESQRGVMGQASRVRAEELFDERHIVDRYEQLMHQGTRGLLDPRDWSWPLAVPESALATLAKWDV